MLQYLILFVVLLSILRQNIETFNGTIEKKDMIKNTKEVHYTNHLNAPATTIINNIPTLGIINTKIKKINHDLIKPYKSLLSKTNDIQISKLKNVEDKISIKNIYTIL